MNYYLFAFFLKTIASEAEADITTAEMIITLDKCIFIIVDLKMNLSLSNM